MSGKLVVTAAWLGLLLELGFSVAANATSGTAIPTEIPIVADSDQASYAISTRRDRIGRIIAPVMINGRGPFRFMLDTGANRTVLAESMLARLELPLDNETRISVLGVSGAIVVATAHIDRLDAGALHFTDVQMPVLTGLVLDGIDGILGMDGFEGKKVSADFVKDQFTISQSLGQRAAYAYSVVPLTFLSDRLLMVDVYVGDVRTKAIVDTGGARTLGNAALFEALRHRPSADALGLKREVVDATQASLPGRVGRVPLVQFGTARIGDLDVTFGDFHVFQAWGIDDRPALLIGMDVLGTLAELTIDYRRKELHILPRTHIVPIETGTRLPH
jgi:predicted aspartyl protease